MLLSEHVRNYIFYLFDFLKKSPVKRNVNQIKAAIENHQNIDSYLNTRLDILTKEVSQNVEYYNSYKELTFENFPIVDKNLIRDNQKKFISNKYNLENLIPLTTSGSTGTPFTVYHNTSKRNRNTADTIYFAQRGGYTLGNKLYYFKIWSEYNKKSVFLRFMQNIVAIDVLNLSTNVKQVVEKLLTNKAPIALLGYVSAFETLCKYLDRNPLKNRLKVNSIITMSESLDDYTKSKMEEHFGCPVLSRYSNIENGILAQQTLDDSKNFLVNTASYLIEIFDVNSDVKLEYGHQGRIVVTDLFNFSMPMIRYDTGDLGVLEEIQINGKTRLVLSHVEGRKLDRIFNTKKELISSYIVYKNMWNYKEINQYQFIQYDEKSYKLKITIDSPFLRENELINEFISYLGQDAKVDIEYVNEIPLLKSGKRKKVVNLMSN